MDKIQAKINLLNLVIPGASSRFVMKPVSTVTVVSVDPAQLVCKFAALPTAGQYEFVIATRNGDASMDVNEATRLVTVAVAT